MAAPPPPEHHRSGKPASRWPPPSRAMRAGAQFPWRRAGDGCAADSVDTGAGGAPSIPALAEAWLASSLGTEPESHAWHDEPMRPGSDASAPSPARSSLAGPVSQGARGDESFLTWQHARIAQGQKVEQHALARFDRALIDGGLDMPRSSAPSSATAAPACSTQRPPAFRASADLPAGPESMHWALERIGRPAAGKHSGALERCLHRLGVGTTDDPGVVIGAFENDA